MSDNRPDPDPEKARAWREAMDAPATRGELLQAMQVIHVALMSQAFVHGMLIDGSPEQQREMAVKSLEATSVLLEKIKQMLDGWISRDA